MKSTVFLDVTVRNRGSPTFRENIAIIFRAKKLLSFS
jgi:hypothetical protein